MKCGISMSMLPERERADTDAAGSNRQIPSGQDRMKIIEQYKGLRRELYILFIGRIMTNMGSMVWPMLTLILNQKLGLSAGEIATYMLIYSVVALPMNLIGGKLADRLNKKNIIVVCDIISISGYLYCAFVPVTMRAIIIFALASLFQTIEWPSYDALVADFTLSKDRDRAYSLSYLGSNLGLVLSPTIGGLLFNNHLNLAFLINGCAIALSTVLIFFLIHDVHRETDDSAESEYEAVIEDDTSTIAFLKTKRVVCLFIIASMFANTVYAMWSFLIPMDLAVAHGTNGSVLYGTITSVNCIEVVICTAFITNLVHKLHGTTRMILGQSLILAGYVIFMLLYRSVAFCYIAIIIFTFGEIINTISSSPFLTRRIPASHRGRIIATMSVFTSIASALLQKVTGYIYDTFGSRTTWLWVLGLGAIVLACLAVIRKWDRVDYRNLYETS